MAWGLTPGMIVPFPSDLFLQTLLTHLCLGDTSAASDSSAYPNLDYTHTELQGSSQAGFQTEISRLAALVEGMKAFLAEDDLGRNH